MNYLILILIAALGIWIGQKTAYKMMMKKMKKDEDRKKREKEDKEEILEGEIEEESPKKEELSEVEKKILSLFDEKEKVANNDVERLLNVSDATATRYLDKLQAKALIFQKGEGRGVYYEKSK